ELVEKFVTAMNHSLSYAESNPEEVRRILGTYTEMDEQLIEDIRLPAFPPDSSIESVQAVGAMTKEDGLTKEDPPVDALFPGRSCPPPRPHRPGPPPRPRPHRPRSPRRGPAGCPAATRCWARAVSSRSCCSGRRSRGPPWSPPTTSRPPRPSSPPWPSTPRPRSSAPRSATPSPPGAW